MDNGLEGSKFLEFAQSVSERRRFRGCGVSLGRLGFAGGLGVMEAASAASLGSDWPIPILGVKLTRGFPFNWSFSRLMEGGFWLWCVRGPFGHGGRSGGAGVWP